MRPIICMCRLLCDDDDDDDDDDEYANVGVVACAAESDQCECFAKLGLICA